MLGVLNVNKPKGVSSSSVVIKVKKILGIKKVGHMGTLDPLASGVLPICVGKATRLFDYFLKKRKVYVAVFKFGEETDTLDLEGKVVKYSSVIPTKEEVENAIKGFVGQLKQVPPVYSSKKVNGKKAYDLARNNVDLKLEACDVCIYQYKMLRQIDERTFEFLIECSAGTYIRCLARDLGASLGSCATMTDLKRIKSGNFDIESAVDIDLLTKNDLISKIIPLERVLEDFEKIDLSKELFQKLLNGLGTKLEKDYRKDTNYAIWVDSKVAGIGIIDSNNYLKLKTYFLD